METRVARLTRWPAILVVALVLLTGAGWPVAYNGARHHARAQHHPGVPRHHGAPAHRYTAQHPASRQPPARHLAGTVERLKPAPPIANAGHAARVAYLRLLSALASPGQTRGPPHRAVV